MKRKLNLKKIAKKLKLEHVKFYDNKLTARCISGAHDDEHPSMVIFDNGKIYCSSCGYRAMYTPNGADELDSAQPRKIEVHTRQELEELGLPEDILNDLDFEYRGIPLKIYRFYRVKRFNDYIFVPIRVLDKTVGYIKVNHKRKIYSKSKAIWNEHFANYAYPLKFPDNVKYRDNIILVEGIFDAFYLISQDLPATAMFGTAFSPKVLETKMSFVSLESGASCAYIWYDDDPAGLTAALNVKEVAKKYFPKVSVIMDSASGLDPDECLELFPEKIKKLKKILKEGKNHGEIVIL